MSIDLIFVSWWRAIVNFFRSLFGFNEEEKPQPPVETPKEEEVIPDDKPEQPRGEDENGESPVEHEEPQEEEETPEDNDETEGGCPEYNISYTRTGNTFIFKLDTKKSSK